MTMTVTAPPCMADAEKAAEAVATAEVSAVLLYGSVARGEAGPDSDIDLVAIHDDLDYSTRGDRSYELRDLAHAATGRRVSVYVTDWPEWTRRATGVSTSLEHAITAHAVTLYHRTPDRVRWGKEIGLPATDREEAAGRLHYACRALSGIQSQLVTGALERSALEDRDPGYYLYAIRNRMCTLCAHAQMAMENSLKALIHLQRSRPARTHDLVQLLEALDAPQRRHIEQMFVQVTPEGASAWRAAGVYEYADLSLHDLVPHAHHMARTAIDLCRNAADLLTGTEAARLVRKVARLADETIDRWDPAAEDPYQILGQPPPPEPAA